MRFLFFIFLISFVGSDLFAIERRRPGEPENKEEVSPAEEEKARKSADIKTSEDDNKEVKDRWRHYYTGKWYDPYNNNILKGDIPVFGSQAYPWFFELEIISDSLAEYRDVPTPVGVSSTNRSDSLDLLGKGQQGFFTQTISVLMSLFQGNTSFKPPSYEFRFNPVFNYNYTMVQEDGALRINPARGNRRSDYYFGIQELFFDYHIADITPRYDFISVRAGVQLFNSDFRGFLFNGSEPGVRFFGTWDNNYWQFNVAYFRRVDKDTNSGLNIIWEDRHEDLYLANVYRQDFPIKGHVLQATFLHREDHAGGEGIDYDANGFPARPAAIGDERPKNISSTYFGLNGDGHFHRLNTTSSFYFVFGKESHNAIAGRGTRILAWMAAAELSYDFDWLRVKASGFWASGDGDPFDQYATGFDAVFDNPNFAGGDNTYWQRQVILFIAGGLLPLVNRNSFLPNMRPGKEEGQSNFVNPGLRMFHAGVDIELTPTIKLLNNFAFLQFDQPAVIEALRQDGSVSRNIGYDFSSAMLYRPWMTNNVQMRLGASLFLPETAFKNLYGGSLRAQAFANLILEY